MAGKGHDIIVIGTSAGGLEALDALIGQLTADIPSSIFIVQHMAADNSGGALLNRLSRHTAFACKFAEDGESFRVGRIYIARPDNHLLLKKDRLLVTKGARENRNRPGIDPLFRSAAVAFSTRESALHNLQVDHCVPISEMGALLEVLAKTHARKRYSIPGDIRSEAKIAERVLSDVAAVNSLGQQVPYNCPNCGGVLWEMDSATVPRYRCHTGHSFTLPALLDGQSEKIEETLWIALRMFEERKNLLNSTNNSFAVQRAKETQIHIERIRAILLDPRTWQHSLDRVKKMMSAHPKTKSVRDEEERLENLSRVSKKKASRSK